MLRNILRPGIAGLAAGLTALALTASSAFAEMPERKLEVVGGNGTTFFWNDFEKNFFAKTLPELSGGKLTANAVPYTELGLTGFEVLRLLRLGTYDMASVTLGSVVQDSPELEGLDLPGMVTDMATYRKVVDAYKPIMERELAETYHAKMLTLYPWPGLHLWCNFGDKSKTEFKLEDLANKNIRTFSTPVGDFIEGLGGTAVTVSFAEVVTALQRGQLDCAATSQIAANAAKWQQVTTHEVAVEVGYAATLIVINLDVWNELGEEAQKMLVEEGAKLETAMWEGSAKQGEIAYGCLRNGPCAAEAPAGLVTLTPSAEEQEKLRKMVEEVVVGRWAKRCGTEQCVSEWNDTIGKIVGITAKLN